MDQWQYKAAADQNLGRRERFRSVRREHGLVGATTCMIRWGLMRSSLRLMHRFRVEGRENLPTEFPFVLAGNHSSHLDALAVAAVLPLAMNHRIYPVAAGDTFFRLRSTAYLSGMFLNVLPMARDGRGGGPLMGLRERLLENDCGLMIFPEGTRTRTGEIGRFKAGVGMLVAGTSVPVVPFHLSGTFDAWPPTRRLPRPGPVSIRFGEPMRFPDVEPHRAGWNRIAQELESAVRRLGGPSGKAA